MELDQTERAGDVNSGRKRRSRWAIASPMIIIVVAAGSLAAWLVFDKPSPNTLPDSVVRQVSKNFDPYYLNSSFTTDFKLQGKTISYKGNVLLFSMQNTVGKTLIFTEQRTPPHFDPSMLTTSSQTNTEYGKELITDDGDRTVGTLFSSDNTWIVVNAPSPVGSNTMKQIIGALAPLKPKD